MSEKCWNSFASSDDSSWQHQALRRVLQATAPHGLEWWSPRSSSRQAPASPVGTAQALAIPLCYLHSFANHKEQQSHLYILYILVSSKVIIIFSLCFHCDSCDIGDCRINTTQINLPAEAWCSSGPIAQQHFFSLGWAMLQSCCSVLWTFTFAFVKLWAEQTIDRAAVRLHTHADGWTWQTRLPLFTAFLCALFVAHMISHVSVGFRTFCKLTMQSMLIAKHVSRTIWYDKTLSILSPSSSTMFREVTAAQVTLVRSCPACCS